MTNGSCTIENVLKSEVSYLDQKMEVEQPLRITDFSVASWYLIRTQYDVAKDKERVKSVIEYLSSCKPDIVLLQNIDRRLYEDVVKGMRSLDYNFKSSDDSKRFAVVDLIFSKFPFKGTINIVPLSQSNEGRFYTSTKISLGKDVLTVATGSLEAAAEKIVCKKRQWAQLFSAFKDAKYSIGGFNTNITSWQDASIKVPEGWADAWKEKGDEEFTMNYMKNMLVQEPIQDRPDRIIYSNSLRCTFFTIIDASSDEHPSDHFGIMAHFEVVE